MFGKSHFGAGLAGATWNVRDSVGDWNQVHECRNRYQAELNIAPLGGVSKPTQLESLDVERR